MKRKRYNLFSEHLKELFGHRIHKISVDAGFSCPNRGGSRNLPGCLFCDPGGSGAVGIDRGFPVAEQIERGKEVMVRKYKAGQFLAYFQPFSNTFAPVSRLRRLYDEALSVPDVVGLAVGTRPDCLPEEVLDLLAERAPGSGACGFASTSSSVSPGKAGSTSSPLPRRWPGCGWTASRSTSFTC
ncbi:MAG: hypothetical protein P8Z70_10755 [Desulfuromonadales bacterium]